MPNTIQKDEIINMFNNSEEVINSHDIKLLIRQKLYTISIYTDYKILIKYNNMHKYYYYQLMVLKFTKLIECIIYPNSGFKIKIITNNLVTTNEEQILINNKIEN